MYIIWYKGMREKYLIIVFNLYANPLPIKTLKKLYSTIEHLYFTILFEQEYLYDNHIGTIWHYWSTEDLYYFISTVLSYVTLAP